MSMPPSPPERTPWASCCIPRAHDSSRQHAQRSLLPACSLSSRLPPSAGVLLVLSGGLTPANVTDGTLQVRPRCKTLAVDVSSGVEASKGVKDPEKIHRFVEAVRAADKLLA